jgi:hypothetical protein
MGDALAVGRQRAVAQRNLPSIEACSLSQRGEVVEKDAGASRVDIGPWRKSEASPVALQPGQKARQRERAQRNARQPCPARSAAMPLDRARTPSLGSVSPATLVRHPHDLSFVARVADIFRPPTS